MSKVIKCWAFVNKDGQIFKISLSPILGLMFEGELKQVIEGTFVPTKKEGKQSYRKEE